MVDQLGSRPATLGAGRLLCLDGAAGSGKTTLSAAVHELTGARVVHLDDLYAGWSGLGEIDEQLATLLEPLGRGEPGHYRRYDWHRRAWAETVIVEPAALLVLEGVGCGAARFAALQTLLVWVTAPPDLRLTRGLERDGIELQPQWTTWMREEERVFARERTHERADIVVDGTGRTPPVLR
ncbi:MAG: 4-amino-4-deoxy-L-arabinose transferase [Actinobacteria bacterium]|nr:4-amino-4-deoxy-L-arabinose transferase [Actinomycetota bacterium]